MNEEKRSICDAIFSAIQDDIRNLCDTEIFTQSTFMELGEFFYGKLINSVEGATVDLINTVVSVLNKNSNQAEQNEYYENLCQVLGFELLPKEAYDKDFDIIGGSFHKWVRDERDKLGLNDSDDFELFIKKFARFAEVYERIRQAETTFAEETKYVYYNAQVNFTLQPQLLLAPVCYEDSWPVIIEKINLVARFIDVLIVSRVTNYRSVDYSTIKNFVFNVTKDIRMTDIPTLKQKLEQQYINLAFDPAAALSDLRLNSFTKKYIRNILRVLLDILKNRLVLPQITVIT